MKPKKVRFNDQQYQENTQSKQVSNVFQENLVPLKCKCQNFYDTEFHDPVKLDCNHYICLQCALKKLRESDQIVCPYDNKVTITSPAQLHIDKRVTEVAKQFKDIICDDHGIAKAYFCDTDNTFICEYCRSTQKHFQHQILDSNRMVYKIQQVFAHHFRRIQKIVHSLEQGIIHLKKQKELVDDKSNDYLEQIQKQNDQILKELIIHRISMQDKFKNKCQQLKIEIDDQIQQHQKIIEQVKQSQQVPDMNNLIDVIKFWQFQENREQNIQLQQVQVINYETTSDLQNILNWLYNQFQFKLNRENASIDLKITPIKQIKIKEETDVSQKMQKELQRYKNKINPIALQLYDKLESFQ